MDFGNAPKLAAISPAAVIPRSDVVATPGGVAVDLPPEKTVQSAQAGDAVRVDIGQRDRRDLQQEAGDRRTEARRDDGARREAEQRKVDLTDVIEQRTVIEPLTRTIVLQKTDRETGETVQTLPDEATLKLRVYSRVAVERARLAEDQAARSFERTA